MRILTKSLSLTSLICCLLFQSQTSKADDEPRDGEILGIRDYEFPAYSDARGYTRIDGSQDAIEKYWTEEEYEQAVGDKRFEFQKLIYRSDGLEVIAYVYKPVDAKTALPIIVFNRGSGVQNDIAPVLLPYLNRLAQQGYVVIAPMYRQSDGGEGVDANGGQDVNDLMNIFPVIQGLPYADARNIFMTGESRGAMMVYQAIRNNFPMRAAAVWGGFTDLGKLFETMPGLIDYAAQNWPGFDPADPSADIERRSAILWPDKFGVPVLLMHGERDDSIPVEHTYSLARALQSHNKLYGLIVFADDGHILSRSQFERDRATVRWFRRFSTEAIARMFESLRTDASERELIGQGYSLLERGNMEKAIEVFQIGVNRFPKSANAFDSLGEAFAVAGNLRDAIDCYRQALSLESDPAQRERIGATLATLENRLAE